MGPTAIKFLDSDVLGRDYQNDMFVGDIHNGRVYHFDLDDDRTELDLDGSLDDKIAEEERNFCRNKRWNFRFRSWS